jgi:hypothetical protein
LKESHFEISWEVWIKILDIEIVVVVSMVPKEFMLLFYLPKVMALGTALTQLTRMARSLLATGD